MQFNAASTGRPNLALTCPMWVMLARYSYGFQSNYHLNIIPPMEVYLFIWLTITLTEVSPEHHLMYACMYKRLYPHILCVSHIHKSRRELSAVKPLRNRNSLATEESTRTTYHCVHITYMYMCILVYPYIHLTKNNEEKHTQHSESTGIISKDMRTMLQYTFTVRM